MKQKRMFIKRLLLSLLFMAGTAAGATAQDMIATPLTFEAVEAGAINIINPNGLTIEYSKDGTSWTASSTDPISISVAVGDQVRFRGDNPAYGKFDMMTGESYTRFTATNDVYVYGNVMSLISSTGYPTLTTLERVGGSDEYAMDINLAFLFSTPEDGSNWAPKNNTTIKNHPTKDIVLPATNATRSGYMYMFAGCQGLTRAPELPATDLSTGCYHRMFDSCTALEKAPVLAAATVPMSAYSCMFAGCSNLKYVKCLATDISADDCTGGWLTGVAAEGIFIKAEGMNNWTVGPQGKWNEVNGIPAGWAVSSETPLTLEAVEAGTINIKNPKGLTIEWSKDGATWTAADGNPISISVSTGDVVQLRGDNACYGYDASGMPTHITATNDVYVYGNIMSLVHKDDFATNNTLTAEMAFCELFCADDYGETASTTIKSHPTKDLLLPTTSLPMGAYMYMFANCQGLERAPELPAMTLGPACYHRMFGDCTSLAAAPKLPATTLADECYFSMFDGCTALITAPELPATTLVGGCYSEMFAHCTSLTKAPVLNATTLANNCYEGMFDGCSKLSYVKCLATDLGAKFDDYYTSTHRWLDGVSPTGTFVKAVGMDDWLMDTANGIPAGWTVKEGTNFDPTKAPLTIEATEDATTVTINNPLGLFINFDKYDATGNLLISGSSSGTTITIDGIDAGGYVQLSGYNAAYSSDGTADNSTGISVDKDYYLYGNIMSLTDGDDYATLTTLTGNYAFARLFRNDSHLKNHPTKELVLPATELAERCYYQMFYGCSSLEKAPDLIATKLEGNCYEHMFMNCKSLNYVKCLATDLGDETCTDGWLTNVAPTGTFVQAAGADWSQKGTTEGTDYDDPSLPMTFVHGIPESWTVKTVYTVTMPSSGIATFSANEAVDIPDELTAYTCPAFDSSTSTISLQPIDGAVIPAETGVLLRGDAGASITLESASTDATPVATNLLVAVTTPTHVPATTGDMTNFMLSQGRFIKIADADDDVKMPANKAYLQLPTASIVSGARTIGIAWDEATTVIISQRPSLNVQHVYDLQGRSVVPSAPGLYIINGKKVYIK